MAPVDVASFDRRRPQAPAPVAKATVLNCREGRSRIPALGPRAREVREALVPLCAGRQAPPRPVPVLEVRGIRSSNWGDPLPTGVRSRGRAGGGGAGEQTGPGRA